MRDKALHPTSVSYCGSDMGYCVAALRPITSQSQSTVPADSGDTRIDAWLGRHCWGGSGVQLSHSRAA